MARFHYQRGMKHCLFLLLIFPRLKSKQALSEAKKSIKLSIFYFMLVVETSPNTWPALVGT